MFSTILHATDFSEPAEQAFQLACALAQEHGARLIVLHVIQPLVAGEAGAVAPYYELRDSIEQSLGRLPVPPSVRFEARVEIGTPAAAIVRTARENHCDLIVMGTRGRRGIRRWLLGSVAEKVLRRAPCPVLTVKSPTSALGRQRAAPADSDHQFEHVWMDCI